MRLSLIFGLLILLPKVLWAAACCGSNSVFPSLISGDERMQFTVTTLLSNVVADASETGSFVARGAADSETRQTLRLDFATLISDRWQLGASLPLARRARFRNGSSAEAIGFGDLGLMVGFEAVPVWGYSAWKPKVVAFAGVSLPTGRAPFESATLYQVDALGRGYWNFTLGALAQKIWGPWDVVLLGELHQPLARNQQTPAGNFHLAPAFGGSASLGAGWSIEDFRLGLMLSAIFDGPLRTSGPIDAVGTGVLSLPVTAQLSYMVKDTLSLGALYADNTWLPSQNLPLSRSVSLLLQTRWDR